MESTSNWYFARGETKFGPMAIEQLRVQTLPGDYVWTSGMAEWKLAGDVLELAQPTGATPAAQGNYSQTQTGNNIGYYGPAAGLPLRAENLFRKHALPLGDASEWPMNDEQVAQLIAALKLRRKIRAASLLYRWLFVIYVAAAFIGGIAVFFAIMSGDFNHRSGSANSSAYYVLGGVAAVVIPILVILAFAARATHRGQRWAPLTMGIIFSIFSVVQLFSTVLIATKAGPEVGAQIFSLIVIVVFSILSWRAFLAIPGYRATAAWCQEISLLADGTFSPGFLR